MAPCPCGSSAASVKDEVVIASAPPSVETAYGMPSIRVDGSPLAQASCPQGRERVLTDLAANVSKLAGVRDVAIRLALEEV